MPITTVSEPLSAGFMIISSRRLRRLIAFLSLLLRLSRILAASELGNVCSMVLANASKDGSRPG